MKLSACLKDIDINTDGEQILCVKPDTGNDTPHKATIPAQAMWILHYPVRKYSVSEATMNVQDKLRTDVSSISKLYDQEERSTSQASLFVFCLFYSVSRHNYTYSGFQCIYRLVKSLC